MSFPRDGTEPPTEPARLLQWARNLGLQAALSAPATDLLVWSRGDFHGFGALRELSVEELLRRQNAPFQYLRDRLLPAARGFLELAAQQAQLEEERRQSWSQPLEPPLAGFAALARARLDEVRADERNRGPVFLTEAFGLLGRSEPPAISAEFSLRPRTPSFFTTVSLVGHERGVLEHQCDCDPRFETCAHLRVALEAILDIVFGPPCPFRDWMVETLRIPTWRRQLDALARASTSDAAPTAKERLVWRLGLGRAGLVVEPALQKRLKSGRWSSGRRAHLESTSGREDLSGEDEMRFDILRMQPLHHGSGFSGPWAVKFLESFVDGDRAVDLDPPHEAVRVRRVRAELAVDDASGQLELGVQVEGRRFAARDLESHMLDETHGLLDAPGALLLFELPPAGRRLVDAAASYPARLPSEAHGPLLDVLSTVAAEVELRLPGTLTGRSVPSDPAPFLRLTPDGDGLKAELRVRPLGAKDFPVAAGPEKVWNAVDGEAVFAERDLEGEREAANAIVTQLGLEPSEDATWVLSSPEAALDLVHAARELADGLPVEWPASTPWRTVQVGALRVKVERTADWFGVGGGVEVDGALLELSTLLAAVRKGQRYLQLGPNEFARIESDLAASVRRLDEVTYEQKGQLTASLAAVGGLEELEVDADRAWHELQARMHAARNLKPRVPRELQAELRPYQKEGFRWLARLSAWDAGACLADDMGLGKTLQTLAVLVTRKSHGPTLVVAPTSVGPNWLREAARFTPSLRVRHFHGPGREALLDDLGPGDLLVTSYGTLTVDAEALAEVRFDTLVFDEAQAIKNPRTRRARAARSLDARWRLALTGTPVENHLGELWSIFSVLSPGLLGPWESFQERFAAPIERDGDRDRLEALSRLMRPFVLRRTKDKVAPELPARTEVLEPVELSPAERALYEAARREALAELLEGGVDEGDKLQVLAALTRLRRLACHPKLVQANFTGASSKLSSLLEHLYDVRRARQRALVFSQFTTFLDLVRAQLEREGFEYLYLDGRTSVKRRAELVEQWAAGAADLFLISLKAGGSGLNLTGADYVFHLDPWWNPAVEDQATDRTHRIGQERPVTVVRLIAQATIEEAVVGLHEEKRALADGLLSGTEAAGKLTSAQLVDLIRVGETEAFEAPEPREAAKPEPAEADDRLDAAGLDALGAALARHLDEAVERGEVTAGSAQVYLGSFNHLVRFAETRGGRRTLDAWLDQCVSAVETGRFDGPRSLVKVLRTVINRARRVTPAGPPR